MRTLLQRYFVADATQKRRSMSQATCFLDNRFQGIYHITKKPADCGARMYLPSDTVVSPPKEKNTCIKACAVL